MVFWVLFMLFITPQGELKKIESLIPPGTEKTCMKEYHRAMAIEAPKGTWFACVAIRGMMA